MPPAAVTLKDYPDMVVGIACTQCDRETRYPKELLLAQHGPDIPMPSLLQMLALGCRKMCDNLPNDRCCAYFTVFARHVQRRPNG